MTAEQNRTRAPFVYEGLDLMLDPDNVLNVKITSFLNTTGKHVHVEASYTIGFRYETLSDVR